MRLVSVLACLVRQTNPSTCGQCRPWLELECSPDGFRAERKTVLSKAQSPRVKASQGFYCSGFIQPNKQTQITGSSNHVNLIWWRIPHELLKQFTQHPVGPNCPPLAWTRLESLISVVAGVSVFSYRFCFSTFASTDVHYTPNSLCCCRVVLWYLWRGVPRPEDSSADVTGWNRFVVYNFVLFLSCAILVLCYCYSSLVVLFLIGLVQNSVVGGQFVCLFVCS